MSNDVVRLQDRPVYGFGQVDRILGLRAGTSQRWIDGYRRGAKSYPPVIRTEQTGVETVTWGEFIEARLLAEYRDEGASLVKMRPAVERLRDELNTQYPLASAQTWLAVEGRELVRKVEETVGLDRRLRLVVVRNNQQMLAWSPQAQEFADSLHWDTEAGGGSQVVTSLSPDPRIRDVVVDPLRRCGEPSTRGVPTEVIRELYVAGDPIEMIAEMYELPQHLVEDAVRYELKTAGTYAALAG